MGYRDTYFNKNDAYDNNNGWDTCQKCGRKFRKGDMDIDHIIPQKFGGSSSEWNLQCICKHCNRSKQASMSDTPRDLFNSGKRILKRKRTSWQEISMMRKCRIPWGCSFLWVRG